MNEPQMGVVGELAFVFRQEPCKHEWFGGVGWRHVKTMVVIRVRAKRFFVRNFAFIILRPDDVLRYLLVPPQCLPE